MFVENKKMPEKEKRQPYILALRLSIIILLTFLILVLPVPKVEASNPNLSGVQVGGRVTSLLLPYPFPIVPPYVWGLCPPRVLITVKTPLSRAGEIAIMLPPFMPRAAYNYTTPGVAYIGAYYPVSVAGKRLPLPLFSCPYDVVPVYYGSWFGTSKIPGK